jgi:hypothetical protein
MSSLQNLIFFKIERFLADYIYFIVNRYFDNTKKMSLLRKPRNLILMVYKSLKIKVFFETLLAKRLFGGIKRCLIC